MESSKKLKDLIQGIWDKMQDESKIPTIETTAEKVYVHREGICVARLCIVSAEFFDKNDMIPSCSFENFVEKCKEYYGINMTNVHRPERWDYMRGKRGRKC